ncbi:MAG TPA: DedA family protein [candidate division Zixibacteria bacterium]|jgi:membrane protein DedA with SNARE-associated domain
MEFSDSWSSLLWLQSFWWSVGLFFVAALTEMIFPPFPGDAVFFLGLVAVQSQQQPLLAAFVAALLGGALGYSLLYWFGRLKGRKLFRPGRRGMFSEAVLIKLERWIKRWGWLVIVAGRFLAGVRSAVPLVAGVGRYQPITAHVLGVISILLWNGILAYLALRLHKNWVTVSRVWDTYTLAVLAVLATIAILWFVMTRRQTKASERIPQ